MSTTAERLTAIWEQPPSIYSWLATVDHKKIGMRYLVVAFGFLALGGLDAALLRAQLARPENHLLSPETYDQLFTMHGTTMIFWYASPMLSGFGNFLVPLMIGSRDMAFPRLNAFGFWAFLFSGLLHYIGITQGMAPHTGWFAYTPLSSAQYSPGLNTEFYTLALLFLAISTTRRRDQLHRDDLHDARAGHVADAHAAHDVEHADDVVLDADVAARAVGGADLPRCSTGSTDFISSTRCAAARRCSGSICSGCSAIRGCTS